MPLTVGVCVPDAFLREEVIARFKRATVAHVTIAEPTIPKLLRHTGTPPNYAILDADICDPTRAGQLARRNIRFVRVARMLRAEHLFPQPLPHDRGYVLIDGKGLLHLPSLIWLTDMMDVTMHAPEYLQRLLAREHANGELLAIERKIMALVTGGATNAQIALTLEISVRSVTRHLGKIFSKLGAANRIEAASNYADLQ